MKKKLPIFVSLAVISSAVSVAYALGGNPGGQVGQSWSVSDANSDILLMGANIAF